MRFLIHSNAPWVSTGYGVQTAYLAERLKNAGHDVAISCTYGQQGNMGSWHGIPCYPTGYDVNGNDIIHNHAMHWFQGDPSSGWIITLLDVWCLVNPLLKDFNIAAWTPVDHSPVPPDVLSFFHRTDAIPVAMSRFGERELAAAGLDPLFIPLTVDTSKYKPTPDLEIEGKGTVTGRQLLGLPEDAFVVGMVAMNKGWSRDRKGFNEAFRAFGQFWRTHQDAVLYVHADWPGVGTEGINLKELAQHAHIPPHALVFADQYAYRMGFAPEMMAAAYSAMDVLLSPSHGEGFCVPLIESQACGTPVIAANFSSQTELAGDSYGAAGSLVFGQEEWDPAQHASYICPYIPHVVERLEEAYTNRGQQAEQAVAFAAQYDTDRIFETMWIPFLAELEAKPEPLELERTPMERVDVIVPLMRFDNLPRLVKSFHATNDGSASLVVVHDDELIGSSDCVLGEPGRFVYDEDQTKRPTTYAEKVNLGFTKTDADWVLLVGDDTEFKLGWLEAARKLSDRFDVIGTNDAEDGNGNPRVQNGTHADHFFVRRSYVEKYGACLDGPGVLAPEIYGHFYTDVEMIELAKARGVFAPCLDSVIEHHHPDHGKAEWDDVYQSFSGLQADKDRQTWSERAPLVRMQRTGRGKR